MVEAAWAGGATPVVVVADDPAGTVAAALAGAPAVLAEPPPQVDGAAARVVRGMDVARERVGETDAVLVWPGRMVWVDAETVTSLIEAHGAERHLVLRPAYRDEAGWPALVPVTERDRLSRPADAGTPDDLLDQLTAAGLRVIETGDPGVVHDAAVAIDELPPFEGPPEPVGGPPPEWGSAAADDPDEGPLEGPALAPYGQAADDRD
jgi:CTP:molybdopterin cytidylyltransferase MocA